LPSFQQGNYVNQAADHSMAIIADQQHATPGCLLDVTNVTSSAIGPVEQP